MRICFRFTVRNHKVLLDYMGPQYDDSMGIIRWQLTSEAANRGGHIREMGPEPSWMETGNQDYKSGTQYPEHIWDLRSKNHNPEYE